MRHYFCYEELPYLLQTGRPRRAGEHQGLGVQLQRRSRGAVRQQAEPILQGRYRVRWHYCPMHRDRRVEAIPLGLHTEHGGQLGHLFLFFTCKDLRFKLTFFQL